VSGIAGQTVWQRCKHCTLVASPANDLLQAAHHCCRRLWERLCVGFVLTVARVSTKFASAEIVLTSACSRIILFTLASGMICTAAVDALLASVLLYSLDWPNLLVQGCFKHVANPDRSEHSACSSSWLQPQEHAVYTVTSSNECTVSRQPASDSISMSGSRTKPCVSRPLPDPPPEGAASAAAEAAASCAASAMLPCMLCRVIYGTNICF
jgi:hypothetical protein